MVGLQWSRSHTVSSPRPIAGVATIVVASFAVTAHGIEPWSGTGLAEEVRIALGADKSVVVRRSERRVVAAAPAPTPDADSAREIAAARRIGADYILLGTLGQKARDSEIALHLVRAADASTAWTGTFWRSPADFPSLAGDLAQAVTEAIRADRDRAWRERESPSRAREPTLR